MRILLVNVNTTATMTDAMVGQAQAVAQSGTQIVGVTPAIGPASVEGHFESYLSAVAVMSAVNSYVGSFDAVILAGFGEHGREGLQEMLDVPVVNITEAAAHVSYLIGRTYSVVTTLDRAVPLIQDRLVLAGLYDRCASVRASGVSVLDLELDASATAAAIGREARLAVEHDRAEVICLGCGGMTGLYEAVRRETDVPIVDGVTAAVALAESLHRLGLSTSKIRSYARPAIKEIVGWPLTS